MKLCRKTILLLILSSFMSVGWGQDCIDGVLNGSGSWYGENGDNYSGNFQECLFYGQGTFNSSMGSQYIGEFREDKKSGLGTYNFPNSSVYAGEFKDGLFHGVGVYILSDGTEFEEFFSLAIDKR